MAKVRRRKTRRDLIPPVDICGHEVRVVVDDEMAEHGLAMAEDGLLKVKAKIDGEDVSFWWLFDSVFHELFHLAFKLSGAAYTMRRRLKMTPKEFHEFEEDFLVRPMTPALMSALKNAGFLNTATLLRALRHRRPRLARSTPRGERAKPRAKR